VSAVTTGVNHVQLNKLFAALYL